jgi:hypothetical protein
MSYLSSYFILSTQAMLMEHGFNIEFILPLLGRSSFLYIPEKLRDPFLLEEDRDIWSEISSNGPSPESLRSLLPNALVYEAVMAFNPLLEEYEQESEDIHEHQEFGYSLKKKLSSLIDNGIKEKMEIQLSKKEFAFLGMLINSFLIDCHLQLQDGIWQEGKEIFDHELCPQCKYRLIRKYSDTDLRVPTVDNEARDYSLLLSYQTGLALSKFKNLSRFSDFARRAGCSFVEAVNKERDDDPAKWITQGHIRRIIRELTNESMDL